MDVVVGMLAMRVVSNIFDLNGYFKSRVEDCNYNFYSGALTNLCFAAFRDRNAGTASNRGKPTGDGEAQGDRPPRAQGTYEGRGRGRGGRGRGANFDRHSRGVGG